MGTDELESAEERTSQNMEKKRASEGTHGLVSVEEWTSQDIESERANDNQSLESPE
jgi:hypothetical protein